MAGNEAASNDIIVTARRRDESAQDVPLVVNAVTGEDIEKLNLRNFNDVQNLVPGLSLSNVSNGTGGNASLRGVNFDVNASGFNPTVEFYQNDAPIQAGLVLQAMYDVGQVEVLRGPQGTLRGRAAPSGSITVTTRKPDLFDIGGYVSATGNDIGTINLNGGFGIPIIEGVAAIRVAGVWDENDVDRVRTINGGIDRRDPYQRTKGGRISAKIEPFDALSLEGSYQKMDKVLRAYDQVESFSLTNPAAAPSPVLIRAKDRLSILDAPRSVHQEMDVYNWQAQLALAGQRLIYVGQHYTLDLNAYSPQDQANFFPDFEFGQLLETHARATSHEIRIQNEERLFDLFDYVVGFFDNKTNSPSDLVNETPVALPPFLGGRIVTVAQTPVARTGKSHEQSFFGNLTAQIGDRTEISGGLRYIDYHNEGSLNIANRGATPDPTVDEDTIIYTASIKHNFSDDLMIYAATGSSWRPPINVVGDFSVAKSALENSFLNLPPEKSESYEIGFKSTLFDKRLRLNVTAYHQDYENYPYRSPRGVYYVNYAATVTGGVVTITPTVSQFNFVAAVPVKVNGVEADVSYAASDNWDIGAVASYSLGKIKNGLIPCTDLNGDGVPDPVGTAPTLAALQAAVGSDNLSSCQATQRSSFQPPFSFTLQSEYRMDLSSISQAYLRGLFSFYGNSQADPTNSFDNVDSYGLLNLYTGLRDHAGQWEISLFVKNAFNVEKALARSSPQTTGYQVLTPPTFRTTAGATATSTYVGITSMTPPREFGLSMRYAFGAR